ncbi:MAG: ribose 5-phosphate isomerase B [Desulfobulbus propionicus]|nr:MAG: ribose 5-phosphate isomerase B [Desulfobulbus propionicus]
MKVLIGSDHGGFSLKQKIVTFLEQQGHRVEDCGCTSTESVDYPDFAQKLCQELLAGDAERGILVCGTGIGMSISANRFQGVRAALCHDNFTARMSREHNDANVLCLGERVLGDAVALDMVKTWMTTEFTGGRHQRRLQKMD